MATTVANSTNKIVAACMAAVSNLIQLPSRSMWVDYDDEADVLYISFRKPQRATKTIEMDDDVLVRKSGKTVVGLTIMNASTRRGR